MDDENEIPSNQIDVKNEENQIENKENEFLSNKTEITKEEIPQTENKEIEILSNQIDVKNEEIPQIQNKENISLSQNIPKIYSNCTQSNFTITSNNKSFNLPLSIQKWEINFLQKNITEIKDKKSKRNFVAINNTSIFIGGRQNLKGMRIYLSNNYKYNNTVHKEISNFKNNKNKSVDKTNIRMTENKPIEKVSINLFEQNNKENKDNIENKEKINFDEAYKMILLRWKNNSNITKSSISYINTNESFVLNKKIYINEFINKINIDANKIKNSNNKENNNKEKYILIKQDKYNKENKFIHDIICPNSNEELETSINNFIYKVGENKENIDNNDEETLMSTQETYLNNGKKKSKFSSKKVKQIKKIKQENTSINSNSNNNVNNTQFKDEDFMPIFIFTEKDIINLYELIDKKPTINNKPNNINYSIENKIFLNIIKQNNDNNKLRGKGKHSEDINFDIFPVKGDKFEFINIVPNELKTNYNIDVSNIALNQSDYMKQVKGGENDFDYLLNKNKDMEDFSQNTPISLLQEKYFIYAVSKWIKYSIPNPQSQLYVKYNYKTGHPMFDPINLIMTNFTLWIERIETKRNDNRKGMISISSSVNYNNIKNNKNQRVKSSNKKKGYVNIYSNYNVNQINNNINNNSINENNQMNRKRNNSKTKVYK